MNTDAMAAQAIAEGYDHLGHFPRDFSYWELRALIAKVAHNAAQQGWHEGWEAGDAASASDNPYV